MKKMMKSLLTKTKTFTIADYGVLKGCVFFFGLWLATIIPVITDVNPWIYFVLWTVLYAYLIWKLFIKKH